MVQQFRTGFDIFRQCRTLTSPFLQSDFTALKSHALLLKLATICHVYLSLILHFSWVQTITESTFVCQFLYFRLKACLSTGRSHDRCVRRFSAQNLSSVEGESSEFFCDDVIATLMCHIIRLRLQIISETYFPESLIYRVSFWYVTVQYFTTP